MKANYVVLMETGPRIKPATTPNKKLKTDNKRSSSDSPELTVTKKRSDLLVINGYKVIVELKSNVLFTGILGREGECLVIYAGQHRTNQASTN